jgi:hypothetical protein
MATLASSALRVLAVVVPLALGLAALAIAARMGG